MPKPLLLCRTWYLAFAVFCGMQVSCMTAPEPTGPLFGQLSPIGGSQAALYIAAVDPSIRGQTILVNGEELVRFKHPDTYTRFTVEPGTIVITSPITIAQDITPPSRLVFKLLPGQNYFIFLQMHGIISPVEEIRALDALEGMRFVEPMRAEVIAK